jgi:hypothetical protein
MRASIRAAITTYKNEYQGVRGFIAEQQRRTDLNISHVQEMSLELSKFVGIDTATALFLSEQKAQECVNVAVKNLTEWYVPNADTIFFGTVSGTAAALVAGICTGGPLAPLSAYAIVYGAFYGYARDTYKEEVSIAFSKQRALRYVEKQIKK